MVRAALLLSVISLAGCSWYGDPASPGNPSHTAYAGEPGSVFDSRGPLRAVRAEPAYTMPPVALMTAPGPVPGPLVPSRR
jgi:hypothetical protein